ncbi:putative N-acetylmannosaminyltransferase [compost metagenome]
MSIPVIRVIDAPVSALTLRHQLETILSWATNRESRYVCVANVHMLMEAHWAPDFRSVLESADLVAPDGMPLVWMMRRLGSKSQDRVAGMDLTTGVLAGAEKSGLPVYFLGGTDAVLASIRNRLKRDYPNLKIAGMEAPPFRALNSEEENELINRIKHSDCAILFVALGCPKQERWMAKNSHLLGCVMVGVGGVFPVYAGLQKRAPRWIRQAGLEWLFRLAQEPNRLWGRYWRTNLPFIFLAIRQLASKAS